MATVVETVLATVKALQAAFLVIAGLGLTAYKYPVHTPVQNGTSYDFVIIGAGPGGSVMANRLTENPNVKVLLIEAGGDPPLESVLPGLFTLLPGSSLDYQYLSTNDNYTSQNLKEQRVPATAGKLLGGSSSISHTVHVRGNPHDYALWAKAAGDNGWNYDNMLPYLMKSEKLIDQDILKTPSARFHGRNGYLSIKKQPAPENEGIMAAFNQMGLPTAQNQLDPSFTLGIGEPFVNINAEGYRSLADEYLKPLGERPNFTIMKNSVAHQIYFRLDKTIEGVGVWITEGEEQRWAYIEVKREVIVSAGVFGTPKLLMLSGIGPREQLQSHHIPVISDLPVGKDLQDHIPAVIVSTLQAGEPVTTPANPHLFPVPITAGYHALDRSQTYPDYQTLNLLFPADNTAQIQITSMVFGFNNNIAQQFFDGGAGRATLISIPNIMQSLSRGEVLLNSTDYKDDPIIRHGIYSNEADLHNMVLYLQDFSRIYNTTAFKSIGAKMIDLDLPACNNIKRGTYEYWKCYALETSASLWAYTSTARMGTVLDSRLRVRGVHGVRVVDASAMPNSISGNIHAGVFGLAERAADLVKADWGASPRGMA